MDNRFWAVTCFFNPAGFRRPRENWRTFVGHYAALGVQVLTVECAFGDAPFQLDGHGKIARVRSRSILWQKERLLAHACSLLPDDCDVVLWLDADILYPDDAFVRHTRRELEQHPVCQAFDAALRLFPGQTRFTDRNPEGWPLSPQVSAARLNMQGKDPFSGAIGFAWAARRELLPDLLYQRAVVGAGDYALLSALVGREMPFAGTPFGDDLIGYGGRIGQHHFTLGCVPATICHLYHGELTDRRYADRQQILLSAGYNPAAHLRDNGAAWEWHAPPPGLPESVATYFTSRREDR
jgi:hypothetical protein